MRDERRGTGSLGRCYVPRLIAQDRQLSEDIAIWSTGGHTLYDSLYKNLLYIDTQTVEHLSLSKVTFHAGYSLSGLQGIIVPSILVQKPSQTPNTKP